MLIHMFVFFLRSFAAVSFSVPENTIVTISGDFWLQNISQKFQLCDTNLALTVPYCSPSLAIAQGEPDDKFYFNDNLLQTAKPRRPGWSSFSRTFRTKANSSGVTTLYLMQESKGPFSASYFANLQVVDTHTHSCMHARTRTHSHSFSHAYSHAHAHSQAYTRTHTRTRANSASYFANLQVVKNCLGCDPPASQRALSATTLRQEVPVAIDCALPAWWRSNAVMRCGIEHAGRENVVQIIDDGEW